AARPRARRTSPDINGQSPPSDPRPPLVARTTTDHPRPRRLSGSLQPAVSAELRPADPPESLRTEARGGDPSGSGTRLPSAGHANSGRPAGQPNAGEPNTGQPNAGRAAAGQPNVGQPNVGQPNAGRAAAGQPNAGQPNAGRAAAGQPNTGQANTGQANTGQANAGQANAGQASTGQPR